MGLRQGNDPTLLVLVSLAGGPKHGYALIKDIEDFAGVSLGPGTLYGCIQRLEAEGWVEAMPADDRRRPYRLTAMGAVALRERADLMARVARVGKLRLSGGVA